MTKEFKRVGTHNGRFHADEVMSTSILKELFDIEVVRTRNLEVLKGLDIVYDVGDGEFDHHQLEKEYRENGIPYAACGLIWRHFGRDVVKAMEPTLEQTEVEDVFNHMDEMLISGIDASDNGVKTGSTYIPTMNISSIVAEYNPPWDSGKSEDDAFHDAVSFASSVFENMLKMRISVIRAKSIITDAFNNRKRPEVLILEQSYPWTQALYEIDEKNEVLFVIYPREDQYLIQTVRKNDGTYGDRKRLPESWAGKRDEELNKEIGIKDAVFCHSARFIAGARSLESILKMADMAVAEPEPVKVKEVQFVGFIKAIKKFLMTKQIVIRR